jgi:small-conductance mechanosensitive channel
MVFETSSFTSFMIPLSILLSGILAGVIIQWILIVLLRKAAAKTKWEGDDIILNALKGFIVVVFFSILGIYGAISVITVAPGISNLVKKILLATVILLVTWVITNIAAGFVQLYANKVRYVLPSSTIFKNLTKAIILILGFLVILQTLGISITPMLTALGVGGLAVALALQDTLANLFAGLHIILSRQLHIGDYVKIESGETGYVADISWRNTTIRMLPNNTVVIPNAKLATSIVTNYYLPEQELAVLVQVGVAYDSDLIKVERVTIDVAKEIMQELPGAIAEFEPFIRYHTFGDFSINFTVIMRAKEFVDQYLLKHEFIKRLHKRYQEEGIEIPFPIRTVYMGNYGESKS